jgi:hypothetical protein
MKKVLQAFCALSVFVACANVPLYADGPASAARPRLPSAPRSPRPTNGATDVTTATRLTWRSDFAATYDVYFGTSVPLARVSARQAAGSYTPPAPLANSTTYYWQIVAYNSNGSTSGPVWSFTTLGSGPTVWVVQAGGNVQAALDSAAPGDTILLEAGATFTGNFVLRAKSASATQYITIRSSAADSSLPPRGVRIDPAHASQLPKLRSPNSSPALATAPYAHHYRIELLEFLANPGGAGDIVTLGSGSSDQNTLSVVPHDLILDRVYIHGGVSAGQKRGIALNSAATTIQNSYISEIKSSTQDSQAICGWNGPGPYTITNNYLEASGENIMFGGADPAIPGLVPSDITLRGNYLTRPLAWRSQAWIAKNVLELKNAQRVTIEGNVLEHNWVAAQSGYAVLFTPRNQGGTAPWSVVQDVLFTNNVVRYVSSALNILGTDNERPSQIANNITIRNNLFEEISGAKFGGDGRLIQINGGQNITLDHNTVLNDGSSTVYAYGTPVQGFVFTNNIILDNKYGITGDNATPGNGAIAKYFPNSLVLRNIIVGAPPSSFPAGNYYPPTTSDVGFVDFAGRNYRLSETSQYQTSATDGRDIGCDIDALNAAAGTLY